MATLSVTARGQVTFRKDVLRHLGIEAGEQIDLKKMPDGSVSLSAKKPSGSIDDFIGSLKGKSKVKLTIEEINQVIADGWAGKL